MNPIPYNGDGGYLSKDDIIKGMAAEIEMLKKELNISNQMKFTYMDDCTKMLAEYARLKAEVERLRASSFVTAVPVEQYERVIKAGDLMSDHLAHEFGICPSIEIWNAAKEGKPSA